MGEVEWSASSSETNPMLGIGRQSKRQSIGIMWGLSRPTFFWEERCRVPLWQWWQLWDWHRYIYTLAGRLETPSPKQILPMLSAEGTISTLFPPGRVEMVQKV